MDSRRLVERLVNRMDVDEEVLEEVEVDEEVERAVRREGMVRMLGRDWVVDREGVEERDEDVVEVVRVLGRRRRMERLPSLLPKVGNSKIHFESKSME